MPISFDPALGYTQNFDSLPSSGSPLTWANDSTLTGWSLFRQPAPGTAITTINADSGASTSGSFVSYGMAGSTDRSLGGLASGGAYFGSPSSGSIAGWLTFSATHSGPATIDSLQIAFDGEQWRNGGNTSAQTMVIEYGIGPSFDAVTTWVKPGGNFDWSAPVVGSTNAVVDGNLAGRVAGRGGVLSGLGWDAGETLWVRWVETNDSGSDHGLAIDNFSLAVASAPSKPQLSVLASDAVGSESGGEVSFRFTRTGDTRAELTVPLTFTGAGVSAEDWAVQPPASITFAAGAASVDLVLKPVADSLAEGAETVTVTLSSSTDYELVSASASATLLDGASITSIAAIQGTGGATPVTANTVVSVEGRISAWFPGLGLFFIESDLVERDNDPKTSEGLAVYYGGGTSVILPLGAESVGDRVLLTGKVTEFNGLTQLGGLTDFDLLSPGTASDLAPPVVVTLPLASESDFEAYEGMRVTVRAAEGDLHVANTYTFARYGELTLYAGGVPQTYTQFNDPSVTGYAEYQAGLSARRIQIDDGSSKQNPSLAELNAGTRILRDADPVDAAVQSAPMGGTGASVNFVRVGDTADSVTGVLSYNFGAWEIHPTADVLLEGSKRPRAPEPIPGAEIKLASFNVLNYFTTLGAAKFMTPAGNEIEARGATNEAEFAQQHAKIVNAMLATGAQVIGLNEIQNNGFGEGSAIDTLTDALNAAAGKDRFAYISSPASGSDAIMVAILYDKTVVSPLGSAAVPDRAIFDAFAANNRLPVAQTFTLGNNAATAFTVVVNHLKSKGSAVAGVAGDSDALDGQGQANATRVAAAEDLVAWLATNPTASPTARTALLGDLNSYLKEDPIGVLEKAGFAVQEDPTLAGNAPSYSYVFDGLTGSLDHALTRGFAAGEIAGATVFQINSPEQIALDYNDEFFPQDITAMDSNDMYRSSDHDPVILGLNLTELGLTRLSTYSVGQFDKAAAEIVAYDAPSKRMFLVNAVAAQLQVLDLSNPSAPVVIGSLDFSSYGTTVGTTPQVNSVAVSNGLVAVAVSDGDPTAAGKVVLFKADVAVSTTPATPAGAVAFTAGVGPDMVTFSPDGLKVLVANEAESINERASTEPFYNGGQPFIANSGLTVVTLGADAATALSAATVQQLDFTAYNGKEGWLRERGVRIAPGATASNDLEPEYIAVSPNGKQAMVTLQENNALAVIDLSAATAKIVDIVPMGYKNHSRGDLVMVAYDELKGAELPSIGTDAFGNKVPAGGFSGLQYLGTQNGKWRFLTVSDRGPNGEPINVDADGALERPFVLPDYQARVTTLEFDPLSGQMSIVGAMMLAEADGTPLTGLPNIPGADEEPVQIVPAVTSGIAGTFTTPTETLGYKSLSYDPMGADLEGVYRTTTGSMWMVDEYRPAVYEFDASGKLMSRFVPLGTAALTSDANDSFGTETLPAHLIKRQANRGFEALAVDEANGLLFAFVQSPLDSVSGSTADTTGALIRIELMAMRDLPAEVVLPQGGALTGTAAKGSVIAEFAYLLERPALNLGALDKIGDAAFNPATGTIFVFERDSSVAPEAKKVLYEIDLRGATNLLTATPTLPTGKTSLEALTVDELLNAGINPVYKERVANLPSLGYTPNDKAEGLAIMLDPQLPGGLRLTVINDNDFGVNGAGSETIGLGIFQFNGSNRIDSDNDTTGQPSGSIPAISITAPKLYGAYMPDAIAAFSAGGKTYYITANEGDSRGVDEVQIGDLGKTGKPVADTMAGASSLDASLKVITDGIDVDGDGDLDKLVAFGGRSFSIFDAYGNRIYDSGDQMERTIAEVLPGAFNASHTNNSVDNRSDDKGPEPEGVTTATINGRVYALVGLERIGGVMVYDVTDPYQPTFVSYSNNRDFSKTPALGAGGDLGPEGLLVIPASDSPNSQSILAVANEVSGTVSLFNIAEVSTAETDPTLWLAGNLSQSALPTATDLLSAPSLSFSSPDGGVDLAAYQLAGRYALPAAPTASNKLAHEASGVTYNKDTDTLFVVGDGGSSIAQVTRQGVLVDSMALATGTSPQGTYFYDTEGIAALGNGKFVMVEERDRELNEFTYQAGGTLGSASGVRTVKLGTSIGNVGLEGLSFDPVTGGFLFAKEATPQGVFQSTVDFAAGTASNGSPTTENSVNLFDPAKTGLASINDIFALANALPASSPDHANLLLISAADGKLLEMNRQGDILGQLNFEVAAKNEGITMDPAGNIYVVGEEGGGSIDRPELLVFSPTQGKAAVAPTANFYLSFDGPVTAGSGSIVISDGASDVRSVAVADGTQVSIAGATVTINPTAPLASGRSYSISYEGGVFKDGQGVAVESVSSGVLSFETAGDLIAPRLVSTSPVNGAAGVTSHHTILSFDEPVKAGVGAITISGVNAGGLKDVRSIPVGDVTQVTISGTTVDINPSVDLRNGYTYTVNIGPGVIADLAGNAYPGFAQPNTLSFVRNSGTAAGPQTVIISEINSDAAGGDFFELYNYGSEPVILDGWKWDDDSASFTDSGAGAFPIGTSIDAGARLIVVASNPDAFRTAWSLSSAVTVVATGGPGLGKGDAVVVFNQAAQAVTALNYGIAAKTASDGSSVPVSPASSGVTATTVASHAGAAFGATDAVSAVWDGLSVSAPAYRPATVGQLGAFSQPATATTIGSPGLIAAPEAADTLAPQLTATLPVNGALSALATANIVLNFSEPVRAGSGNLLVVNSADASDTRTISVTDASQVTIAGGVVTINPASDLRAGAAYSVQLAAGVIEDLAGNDFAGLAGENSITFSVAAKAPKLLITELNSNAAPADFFELHNYGDAPLSLKGWRWDDDSASFTDGAILPDISIPAGGSLVVVSTAPTALATFKTTWGLADDVPVIVSEGPGLGGGDAVVIFNDAGSVVTSFNYSGSTKLATDGSTIGLSTPAAGVTFTPGVHAGPAFGGAAAVNGVSAVWDGVSTSEPAYQAAKAGALDGIAQAGNANNVGSPGFGVPVSSSVFTLQLLHFADAEAAMLASQTAPYLAALVDKFEDAYANSITLAGGDNFIPSPFMAAGTDDAVRTTFNSVTGSTVTGTMPIGAVDIALHNLIGVQASAVGNHEFDLGSNVLVGAFGGGSGFAGAQFPYISSNLDVSGDSALKARFTDTIAQSGLELASTLKGRLAPSAVIEVNGEKIGLVGATTQLLETISSPSGTKVKDNDGVRSDDMPLLATHLQPVIDDLTGQGVDKIILLAHLQSIANEKALAPLLSGVDVILAAGSNTRLGDANDVAVAFPGHAANFADTYPLISQGKDGAVTLIVNTDNEFTYLGRLVVDFDAQGRIVTESLAANASINGAYAATVSNVATAWGVAETALDSTAFATGTKGGQVKALTDAVQGVITVKDSNVYGYSEVYLEGERINVRNQETNLGSLSADANGYAAEQALGSAAGRPFVVSIKNGGGIRAQIGTISAPKADGTVDKLPPEGGVSQLDVENSLRFDNKLMAFDTTPEGLKAILEHGVASLGSQGRFPQIGGVSFAYDPDLPAGSRITDIALIDSESTVGLYDNGLRLADTPAKITVSTLNFLANGGDGYPMKANGENFRYLMLDSSGAVGFSAAVPETANYTATDVINTFVTSGFTLLGEQKAFETYMKAFHGTPLSAYDQADRPADLDTRIQNMNARSESILEESVFGMASTLKLTGAEISAFDPESGRLFVTSSAGLQVIKVGLDLKMTLIGTVALGSNDINSVAVKNGMVAVAVAAADKTQPGSVYLLDAGAELAVDAGVIAASAPLVRGVVAAGALPDMLTFTPDGMKILVANEGEQNAEGSNPEGSVTIINLERMWAGTGEPTTATATFTAFNNQRDALKAEGVRLFAGEPGFETISVAQDLEPEYIAVSPDGKTAMVTLQENNAVGVLDIASASFRDIVPLGLKDFSTLKLDTNDKDGVPVLKTGLPVFGLYMPDAITAFTGADGKTYYAIANEGDDRDDFITPGETIRVGSSSYVLDPTVFPNAAELKSEAMLGRLTVSNAPGNRGDLDGDGDIDQIIAYGARSFSILNDQGQTVYDSGSLIEEAVARGGLFSSASPSTTGLFDDGRSDNKGPEPEGITVGRVEGRMMAFVGLERGGGGVMVYDVTDPTDVSFVQYLRNAADVSPEGLSFVPADLSPSGKSVLFVTNEVSMTVTAFEYQGIEPIVGTADDDVLIGTPGDDLFSGDAGDDVLIGLDGDDHAVELSEGDIFIGGLGQDRAHFDGPSAHYRVILATPGQRAAVQSVVDGMGDGVAMSVLDQGPLYAVTSRLPGRSGTVFVQAEQLQFGDADPVDPSSLVLNVGAGGAASLATAVAAAQPGDTIVVAAGHVERGAVVIDRDDLTLVLEGSGPALHLVLAEASSGESSTAAMTSALSLSTSASGVTRLTLMGHRDADVTGNSLDNVIIGNDGHNHIDGKGGNDTLIGQGGDDELRGGAGDDWLDGNEGWDRLFGGSGNDRLLADAGGDEDPIDGDRAADVMSGGSGNDLLIVATDNGTQVQMLGGSGRDLFRFMSLDDGRDDKGELLPATELSPLDVAAFIADLTAADGIDFSALRDSPQASAAPAGLDSSGALAGDLRFDFGQGSPNAGLQVVGLTPVPGSDLPVFDGAGRRSLVMGELKLALVSASDVNAAIQRGSDFSSDSSFGEASGFDSINTLLVELSPIYATIV